MTPPPRDLTSRRAQIRAIAAGIVDAPPVASRFRFSDREPLRPSARRRCSRRQARPAPAKRRSPTGRRVVAAILLVVQVGVLIVLFTAPAFRVRSIEVTGDRLLGRDTVLAAARVQQSSLFAVDSEGIRSRLTEMPWVRTVSVTTQLPATVRISVTEWQPELVLRRATVDSFVAATGAMLPVGAADSGPAHSLPLLLDDRAGARGGLPAGLPQLMAAIAQRWPVVFGVKVAAFTWSTGGVLSIWSSAGWQAVLGHVDSAASLAAVPGQLAALAALHGKVDFVTPKYGYIDLENPIEPALGGAPGLPAWLSAEIAGAPAPSASAGVLAPLAPVLSSPSPTPTPAPIPRPSPTPLVLGLPAASPSAPASH